MVSLDRDTRIDTLRGLGIIVIIFGHINFEPIGSQIISIFYLFNVPLFFFISGYLWKEKPIRTFRSFIFSRFQSLYLPYIFLFLISILYGHLVVRYLFKEYVIPFDLSDSITSLLLSSEWLNRVPTFNFALWFLPIFFITNVIFFFLQIFTTKKSLIFLAMLLVVTTLPVQEFFPGRPILSLNAIPSALFFMVIGRLVKKTNIKDFNYQYLFVPTMTILVIGSLSFPGNIQRVGSLMYFPLALVGILFLQILAKELSGGRTLCSLGRNSLYIFGLHGLVSNVYSHTFIHRFMIDNFSGVLIWIVNATFVVAFTLWLVLLFNFMRIKALNWVKA
jgi:fucose 4-O-acetylase-like acetyltransferase